MVRWYNNIQKKLEHQKIAICYIFGDVNLRIKKRNKILFARDSECIQELRKEIGEQNHITLVLWAFECMQIPIIRMWQIIRVLWELIRVLAFLMIRRIVPH